MRKLIHTALLLAALAIAGCSSDKDGDDNYGSNNDNFDLYGVGKWDNPEDFILRRFNTLVDNITLKQPNVAVVIKTTDPSETSVLWRIDGTPYESVRKEDASNSSQGITIFTYQPFLPEPFEYGDGMQVSATVKVGKNTIGRSAVIDEKITERDVLCVNFGMSVEEVKGEIESLKGEGKFMLRPDGVGYENTAPHFLFPEPGKTLYFFDDAGLLEEVAEFPGSLFLDEEPAARSGGRYIINPEFLDFCTRLGCPDEIEVDDNGALLREYRWDKDDVISFRVYMRDDVFPIGDGEEETGDDNGGPLYRANSIGISFRLI